MLANASLYVSTKFIHDGIKIPSRKKNCNKTQQKKKHIKKLNTKQQSTF